MIITLSRFPILLVVIALAFWGELTYLNGQTGESSFYWTDSSGKILTSDSDFTSTSIYLEGTGERTAGIAFAPTLNQPFWTSKESVWTVSSIGGDSVEIVKGQVDARAIAVHEGLNRIFWTDASADKIQSANFDGSGIFDVVTGLGAPEGIAIDFKNNKLYWSNYGSGKIQRSDLDGSNIELIRQTPGGAGPIGLSIDALNDKIYWANYAGYLQRMDFDGSNAETIAGGLANPISVVVKPEEDAIYWIERSLNRIRKAKLDGSDVFTVYSGSGDYISLTLSSIGRNARAPIPSINIDPDFPGELQPDVIYKTKILADGSILYAGEGWSNAPALGKLFPDQENSVWFYDDYTIGNSFDGGAPAALDFEQLSDGRIVVVGNFNEWDGLNRSGIVVLSEDGVPDHTFSSGTGFNGMPSCIEVDDNDNIYVGGNFTDYNGTACGNLIKLNRFGQIESVYNPEGGNSPGVDGAVHAIELYENNDFYHGGLRLYVAGAFESYGGIPSGALIRLNLDQMDYDFSFGDTTEITAIHVFSSGAVLVGNRYGDLVKYDSRGWRVNHSEFDAQHFHSLRIEVITMDLTGNVYIGHGRGNNELLTKLSFSGQYDPFFDEELLQGQAVYSLELSSRGELVVGGDFYPSVGGGSHNLVRLEPFPDVGAYSFSLSSNSIDEHQAAGTHIGAFDVNGGTSEDLYSYQLIEIPHDSPDANDVYLFDIIGDQLKSKYEFNFEEEASYSIDVRVFQNDRYLLDQRFTITVQNILTDDEDNDGLNEQLELTLGTDPIIRDSDVDGAIDGTEYLKGSSPTDPDSVPDNYVTVWGTYSVSEVPYDLGEVIDIDGSGPHFAALLADGSVRTWGSHIDQPEGLSNISKIVCGDSHFAALSQDGTVILWGDSRATALPVPNEDVVDIAAGSRFTLFLREDGTVSATGQNSRGVLDIPDGLAGVVAIYANDFQCLALTRTGEIVKWGSGYFESPSGFDPGQIVDLAVGFLHGLALGNDGSVNVWGQTRAPGSRYPINIAATIPDDLGIATEVSADHYHSMALMADGTVRVWGSMLTLDGRHYPEITELPYPMENVIAIASGYGARAALISKDGVRRPTLNGYPSFSGIAESEESWPITIQGAAPDRFSASGLPSGLAIDEATGILFGSPYKAGNYTVRLNYEGSLNHFELVTFEIEGYSYSNWLTKYFSPAEINDPSISSRDSDPNQNGLRNFEEYAFGLNPSTAELNHHSSISKIVNHPDYFEVHYLSNPNAGDVVMVPMTSIDLTEWTDASDLFYSPAEESPGHYSIRLIDPPSDAARFFSFSLTE